MSGRSSSRHLAVISGVLSVTLVFIVFAAAWPASIHAGTSLPPPEKLLANPIDGHRVNVVWLDNAEPESGFHLERARDKAFTQDVVSFDIAAGATSYEDRSVEPLTAYYYRIAAYDGAGESAFSSLSVAFTPDLAPVSPSSLTAFSYRAYSATLSWTDNSYNETGFRLERADTNTFDGNVTVFTTAPGVHQAEDNGVSPGIHYYRVYAFNDGGESAPSSSASVSVASPTPENPGFSGQSTATVDVPGFRSPLVPLIVDLTGSVQRDGVILNFEDGSGMLDVPRGTKLLTADGKPLTSLERKSPVLLPQLAESTQVITQAFEFGPPGAKFDPPITCKLKVDLSRLPSANVTANLRAAAWNGSVWEQLGNGSYDSSTGLLTLKISHFSTVAILAPKPAQPPTLSVSNLIVYPQYSQKGETVLVQVVAKNMGTTARNYELALRLNDLQYGSKFAAVEPGGASTENFYVSDLKSGRYSVDINGLKSFLVVQGETPIPSSTSSTAKPTLTSSAAVTTTRPRPSASTQSTSTSPETASASSSTTVTTPVEINYQAPNYTRVAPNWRLITIIAGSMGFLLIVSLALFLVRK